MKLSDNARWTIGILVVGSLAISIAIVTNLNTKRGFDETNAMIEATSEKNIAAIGESTATITGAIGESTATITGAIGESTATITGAIGESTAAIISANRESTAAIISANRETTTAIIDAIQSTAGNSTQEDDSTPEPSDNIVENTFDNNIFPIVKNENQEVYQNLAGAFMETGLVPDSKMLSPVILISLNNDLGQQDLTRMRSLSEQPITKEIFVTYNEKSPEYNMFWNILAPAVVPPQLEGAPLTISYAIIN